MRVEDIIDIQKGEGSVVVLKKPVVTIDAVPFERFSVAVHDKALVRSGRLKFFGRVTSIPFPVRRKLL